jgi:hypothetical protein
MKVDPQRKNHSLSLFDGAEPSIHTVKFTDALLWEHAAKNLLAQGIAVLPVRYMEKGPPLLTSWVPYQKRLPTETEVEAWSRLGVRLNLAVVCGKVSGNLAELDFDSLPSFVRFFPNRKKTLDETLVISTFRGFKVVFRTTDYPVSFDVADLGLNVLGEGHLSLHPPSVHPSGKPYEVVSSTDEISTIDDFTNSIKKRCFQLKANFPEHIGRSRDELRSEIEIGNIVGKRSLSELQKNKVVNALVPFWTSGKRHHLTIYLTGFLMKRGVRFEDAYDIVSTICDLASDKEKRARLGDVRYHYRNRTSLLPRLKGFSGLRELLGVHEL